MSSFFRIKLVFLFLTLFSFLIIGRLFYWQVVKADELTVAAWRQHRSLAEIPARRGKILASDGFPLAANQEVFLLFATPPDLEKEPVSVAHQLSPLLVDDEVKEATETVSLQQRLKDKEIELKERLSRPEALWVPLQHRLDRETKEKIESLKLTGLGFEPEAERNYPEGTASAHLLGFVGQDESGSEKGYFGLEGFYDLQLKGRPGLVSREKDASGRPILFGTSWKEEKMDGRTLLTTIDRTVQLIISQALEKALERYGAISGTVTVMEPETGAILGMVSLPTYDPETYFRFPSDIFPNPIIAASYEPGSTFKVLVMAAALEEKAVKPETKCDLCAGPRVISGYTLNTWNDRYYPDETMTEILVHSDNVGMVFVGEKLGLDNLYRYLTKFGFGQKTGVDLQEEESPPLRSREEWRAIDLATASFGQGIAVTRLQMIRAVTIIANGGFLVKPHLVDQVGQDGEFTPLEPGKKARVLSEATTALLTQMMVAAVKEGEAKWAAPPGFKIAGKTGTAQIPVSGHYDEEKTIASFVGFAPAGKSRFVMLVTLREPTSSPWGSETAAPLWFEITNKLFTYYGIAPD